jgi:hypothetical protein
MNSYNCFPWWLRVFDWLSLKSFLGPTDMEIFGCHANVFVNIRCCGKGANEPFPSNGYTSCNVYICIYIQSLLAQTLEKEGRNNSVIDWQLTSESPVLLSERTANNNKTVTTTTRTLTGLDTKTKWLTDTVNSKVTDFSTHIFYLRLQDLRKFLCLPYYSVVWTSDFNMSSCLSTSHYFYKQERTDCCGVRWEGFSIRKDNNQQTNKLNRTNWVLLEKPVVDPPLKEF